MLKTNGINDGQKTRWDEIIDVLGGLRYHSTSVLQTWSLQLNIDKKKITGQKWLESAHFHMSSGT